MLIALLNQIFQIQLYILIARLLLMKNSTLKSCLLLGKIQLVRIVNFFFLLPSSLFSLFVCTFVCFMAISLLYLFLFLNFMLFPSIPFCLFISFFISHFSVASYYLLPPLYPLILGLPIVFFFFHFLLVLVSTFIGTKAKVFVLDEERLRSSETRPVKPFLPSVRKNFN